MIKVKSKILMSKVSMVLFSRSYCRIKKIIIDFTNYGKYIFNLSAYKYNAGINDNVSIKILFFFNNRIFETLLFIIRNHQSHVQIYVQCVAFRFSFQWVLKHRDSLKFNHCIDKNGVLYRLPISKNINSWYIKCKWGLIFYKKQTSTNDLYILVNYTNYTVVCRKYIEIWPTSFKILNRQVTLLKQNAKCQSFGEIHQNSLPIIYSGYVLKDGYDLGMSPLGMRVASLILHYGKTTFNTFSYLQNSWLSASYNTINLLMLF